MNCSIDICKVLKDAIYDDVPIATVRYFLDTLEDVTKDIDLPRLSNGNTYFMEAVEQHRNELASLLIQYGSNPGLYNTKDGKDALHIACSVGNFQMAEEMVDMGVAIRFDKNGRTPLHLACLYSKHGAAKVVLPHVMKYNLLDHKDDNGDSALHLAFDSGDHSSATMLLEAGASPNIANNDGNTPLHFAAMYGSNTAALNALLKAGACVDYKNNEGKTPLRKALDAQFEEIPKMLIEAGADVNMHANDGRTPYDAAKAVNNVAVLELIAAGPKIDIGSYTREGVIAYCKKHNLVLGSNLI